MRQYFAFFLFFQLVGLNNAFSREDRNELVCFTPSVHYFVDTSGQLRLEDVLHLETGSLLLSDKMYLSLNPNHHPIWLSFAIDSTINDPHFLFDTYLADSLIAYVPNGEGRYVMQLHGKLVKKESRYSNSILPIFKASQGQKKVIWVKIIASDTFVICLEEGSGVQAYRRSELRTLAMAFFVFLLIFILAANVFLSIFLKSNTLFYFGLFNFFTLLFVSVISGFVIYFPQNLESFLIPSSTPILCLLIISGMLLSLNVLDIYKTYKKSFYVLMFFLFICICCLILHFLGFKDIATAVINPLGGLVIPVYIFTSWKAFRNGQKYALYFLLGWLLYYIVMIGIILFLFGLVPPGEYIHYLTPSISLIDFVFIIATIFSRINTYRIAKETSEKQRLELIEDQNEMLKHKVIERTMELQVINEEFAAQNEELVTQKEQISILNTEQERIIEQKTSELHNTLVFLQKRNNDLEHFSYVVSHNLRSPIASILGLTNIFNLESANDPVNIKVIEKLKGSAHSLDTVIRDLNYIISVQKNVEVDLVTINLDEVLKICLDFISYEITDTSTVIESDFHEIVEIVSIPAYMHSIFYNLISNSIKYRKEGIAPQIHIRSVQHINSVSLHFKDNGIGMELDKIHPEKLFKLYQRFDYSRQGKGIGLYLVKSQVDFLNGQIEIESELGQGTEFVITLPLQRV